MAYNKIFEIGLNKTGTSSLNSALNGLGIKSLHDRFEVRKHLNYEKENDLKPLSSLKEFQGFSDSPFHILYKELYNLYPKSKFILTIRDLKSWLKSREKQVIRNQNNPDYKGVWLKINKEAWIIEWKNHTKEVIEFFKDHPKDLLIINICKGEGWEKLCPFLNLPIPNSDFPYKNKAPSFFPNDSIL